MTGSLLTADDVAELLSVPKSWVYEQSRLGRIPTVTLGRYRRYRRGGIEEWVHEVEALGSGQSQRRVGCGWGGRRSGRRPGRPYLAACRPARVRGDTFT